ncbi:hypothetical protein CPB83DRAFT_765399 [Crepidotus variabilis]|uniref:Uncharacterized protein n=1 Tax=Crepidotus variabilis TaxID=179855 RepID=A0A9P6EHM8_9AGAR|nr:hypothetical protein CPB83DRAFT_765399 [Crepidotus variabilis]
MRRCPTLRCARGSFLKSGPKATRHPCSNQKTFTTSAATRNAFLQKENDVVSPRQEALTLLHKAFKVIPTSLDQKGLEQISTNGDAWNRILSKAHEDLSTAEERSVNVTVFSLDEWSGSQELVSALLSDPLTSDKEVAKALDDRWNDPSSKHSLVHISHGPLAQTDSQKLTIPSSYLSQFPVPIEFLEIGSPSTQSVDSTALKSIPLHPKILESDIPIVLINPLTTCFYHIPISQLPSNTILILVSSTPQADLDVFLEKGRQTRGEKRLNPIRILAADPKRAAQAIRLLQADPNSLTSIQRYQDDVVGSQISSVTRSLHSILAQGESKHSSTPIRTKLALSKIQDASNAAQSTLYHVRAELRKASAHANKLHDIIDKASARIHGSVFERKEDFHGAQKAPENEVVLAINQAAKDMTQVMNRLTWWRMISRIDDITSTVSAAVSRVWCRDLERKLILQTGHLGAIQHGITKRGLCLLLKNPIIQTAILRNDLLQLKASSTYHLTPETLTRPIHSRRDQIITYPTTRLHIAGQKALITMTGGMLSGVGIGWAGWLGWLLGSGEGLLGFLGMDASTALGVGALTAVGGIRWGVGTWEKAKKRWWQDWTRVGQGLERDLKVCL